MLYLYCFYPMIASVFVTNIVRRNVAKNILLKYQTVGLEKIGGKQNN